MGTEGTGRDARGETLVPAGSGVLVRRRRVLLALEVAGLLVLENLRVVVVPARCGRGETAGRSGSHKHSPLKGVSRGPVDPSTLVGWVAPKGTHGVDEMGRESESRTAAREDEAERMAANMMGARS